ncbi:hypothetical protein, partial [Thermococcus sp.]
VGYDIIIKRKHGISTLLKFMVPVILIIFLVIFSSISLKVDNFSEKNSVMVSGLLGVISIYFIFSVIINIEQFVLVDGLFILSIFLIITIISVEMLILGKGESGKLYYKNTKQFLSQINLKKKETEVQHSQQINK